MLKSIFLILFYSVTASGQTYQLDWYNRFIYRDTHNQSFANPQNEYAKIPQYTFETDFRPVATFEKNAHLLKVNPRLITQGTITQFEDDDDKRVKADPFVNEAFYQLSLDKHQIALGFQNYQWGPAEMLGPSNPIFRFLLDQRSFFFQQRGRNLARWNWTFAKSWSIITMIELTKNDLDLPRDEQRFSPNGLVKIEKSFEKSSDYFGIVGGKTPSQENFIGEYGSSGLTDAMSIYFDARHQRETNNFYPGKDSRGFYQFSQLHQDSDNVYTLGTVGIRYETRVDIRLEYIYNGLGLTEKESKDAKNSLTTLTPHLVDNIKRFYRSGRDLNKQHYGYFSVRVPDLGATEAYTLFLRYFNSLQDSSSLSQILIDRAAGDSFNLYLEAATFQGAKDADFSSLISTEISTGLKWSY